MFHLVVSEPSPPSPTSISTPEVVVTPVAEDGAPGGSPEPEATPRASEEDDGVVAAPGWKGKERGQTVAPSSDSAIVLPDGTDEDDDDDEQSHYGEEDGEEGSRNGDGDEDDDWTKYEPPEELKTAPGVESEVILQVIQDSIERIKARIAEDEARRQAEAEAEAEAAAARERKEQEREVEEEAAVGEERSAQREHDKGKRPATASEAVPPPPSPSSRNPYGYAMSKKTLRIGPQGLLPTAAAPPARSKKRSLFALLKKLNGGGSSSGGEKAETSAAGAARHAHSGSMGSFDAQGRRRGRAALDAFKKAASGAGSSKSSMEEDVDV